MVKTISYKLAFSMLREKTVENEGKTYKVKLVMAGIPGKLTGFIIPFTHGNTIYLIPEYSNNTISYYIAYKITKNELYKKELTKIKITNPNKILKHAKIIDQEQDIKLISINNIEAILSGKALYTDKIKEKQLKEAIKQNTQKT